MGGDDKWWKETARLNREQRVLDQQEEAALRKLLEQEVQVTPGVTYKNNRDRRAGREDLGAVVALWRRRRSTDETK